MEKKDEPDISDLFPQKEKTRVCVDIEPESREMWANYGIVRAKMNKVKKPYTLAQTVEFWAKLHDPNAEDNKTKKDII